MYESPINQIFGEIQTTYENECFKAVQSCGFDVNKEELVKALQYDRGQYDKGFRDGYSKAIEDFARMIESHNSNIEIIRNGPAFFTIQDIRTCIERLRNGD